MRYWSAGLLLLLATATSSHAFTLSATRLDAVTVDQGPRDTFLLAAEVGDLVATDLTQTAVTVVVGDWRTTLAPGALRGKNGRFTHVGTGNGLRKLKLNLKKRRLLVVGRGVELGALAAPALVRIDLGPERFCGRFTWSRETVQAERNPRKRRTRKVAREAPAPCEQVAPLVQITVPTFADGVAVGAPAMTLGGVVSDDGGIAELSWSTDRGGGGAIPVAASWSVSAVPLLPGDTRIVVTAVDASGNTASDVLHVTYNLNGLVFDGEPHGDPDAVFVGEPETVTFRQPIPSAPDLDPTSVRLVRVETDGSLTEVGTLVDSGDLATGDEIQGDGVFTGRSEVGGDAAGELRFRVAARTTSQPDQTAYSPIVSVHVIEHVTPAELADAVTLADEAQALYDQRIAGGSGPAAAGADVVAMLQGRGVLHAEVGDGGIGVSWLDANEILGGILGYEQASHRAGGGRAAPAPRPRATSAETNVGSRRALILAPFFYTDEPDDVEALLELSECPSWEVESYADGAASVETFMDLDRYGIVLIASHGNTWYQGALSFYREVWKWNWPGGQVVILTGTVVSEANRPTYERDLRRGRLAVAGGGYLAVLPSFIRHYNLSFPRSLIYVGSCRSTFNASMAAAFLGRGAQTYYGYSEIVSTVFARERGIALFDELVAGDTTGEAFPPGLHDTSAPPAYFTMTGATDLTIADAGILNGSFDDPGSPFDDVPGWTTSGDGRVITGLGAATAPDGAKMAIISTGLGFTTSSGRIAQPICIPELRAGQQEIRLSWDWNMHSEEFLEYCGSRFQDSFRVTFGGAQLYYTFIDELCGSVSPVGIAFDRGDVHATGWRSVAVDVTAYAGQDGVLAFSAEDVGDSAYDSAILIDGVRVDVQ